MRNLFGPTSGEKMSDEIEIPKNSSYLDSKKQDAKSRFSAVVEEYKKLLADKTHPDNQTPAYHNNVRSILTRLLTTADELDKVVSGEGIFGLVILSLRSSLKMRDELIRNEVKLRELERELKKLKR
jgi:hypothetical protein